jgi:hypothetical protein
MRWRNLGLSLFVVAVLGSQAPRLARAEMLVLESNVSDIQTGSRLPDTAAPALPPGGRVKVLLLTSNETKVFERKAEIETRGAIGGVGGVRGPR